ncbi:MAG: TamB, inner membrane protein subunit of complex [Verrucomicrobiota bacterium]|jgi:hypothetical protein
MSTAAPTRTDPSRPVTRRRFVWVLPVAVILLAALWIAQAPLLRSVARFALPPLARSAGYELEFDVLASRFFGPLLLGNVRLCDARGSDLRADRVELAMAALPDLFRDPRCVVRRVIVHALSGGFRLDDGSAAGPAATAPSSRRLFDPSWPLVIEIDASKVFVSRGDRHLLLKDASLLLDAGQTGSFRAGEAGLWAGTWSKTFPAMRGATAWRDGIAYVADVSLADDAVIEMFSATLAGPDAFTVKARAFGGSLYGEWSGGSRTTAALNAFDLSLEGLGSFLGLENPLHGKVGLLKFTFNGDPSDPLASQSSLRAEAEDFSWEKRAFSSLRLGASLSGSHLKIDELLLEQKSNRVSARGSLQLPGRDWRASDVSLNIGAAAKDARALAELFGRPYNKISGGFTIEGDVSGRLGEPSGWLKARGWDLRVPGIPPGSLQADAVFERASAKITSLEFQNGPDFLRASGEFSLGQTPAYRGHLETRIREVSRYLEPLGRFAPDWAREGGALVFWDGDGTGSAHSGVVSLELVRFIGDLNPVAVNGKFAATYSPGNVYVSRLLLDRGPLSLSASCYLSAKGLSAQDIQLFNVRQRLLRSEIFLPVSWPLLLEGKSWSQTMLPGGQIYAAIRSDDLRLGPLANLFGQDAVAEGRVDWKLDASGPWENPSGESILTIDGFRAAFDSFTIPVSRFAGKASLAAQRLEISGELDPEATEAAKFIASIPLLGRNDSGGFRVLDRTKPASAQLDVPVLDLKKFASARSMDGTFGGSVKMSGQLSAPRFDGAFQWDKVTCVPVDGLAPVTDFAGRFVFSGAGAKFESARGKMGGGAFTLEGESSFSDFLNITSSAKLSGKRLQLVDSEKFRFAADVDLVAGRREKTRTISGEINLVEGSAQISLSATPLLLPAANENKTVALAPPFKVGGWLGNYDAAIRIRSAAPVQFAAGATAAVDISLAGLLRDAVPSGMIEFQGLQAALPSGALAFSHAKFSLVPAMPWVPVLDLAGLAQLGGYQVAATVWGPLGQQQLKLASVPESSPAQIALLLGTGISPEKDVRLSELRTETAKETVELPPPQIGCTWQVQ